MFRSKIRSIVIPQYEHLRQVGALAMAWGNGDFEVPPINRDAFVVGIGMHDRGYGTLDNNPIGEMGDDEWFAIARRGFSMHYADAVADVIALYHIRRLASHGDSPARRALAEEFSRGIDEHIEHHQLDRQLFDRIDRITELCDRISFTFCFEAPGSGSVSIFPQPGSNREVPVSFAVEGEQITVSPWPFRRRELEGYILGYRSEGYPASLDPVLVRYHLSERKM